MDNLLLIQQGSIVALKETSRFFPKEKPKYNQFAVLQIENKTRFRKFGGIERYQIFTVIGNGKVQKIQIDEIQSLVQLENVIK